jgi:hypothetical protein
MFKPDCRKRSTFKKMFPRVRTLQAWARTYFPTWLRLKQAELESSGPEGYQASLHIEGETSQISSKLLQSRWTDNSMSSFFAFKDSHGGSEGNHCFRVNQASFLLNICFSETTEELRLLFGCNRRFLLKHEADLRSVFRLKRYYCL